MFENIHDKYEVHSCLLVPDALPVLARLRTEWKDSKHEGLKDPQR